ncbi:MAG: CAP domain-containing protein [Planctomycetaceae bacterium]
MSCPQRSLTAALAVSLCAALAQGAPLDEPSEGTPLAELPAAESGSSPAKAAAPHAWLTEHPTIQSLVALTNQQRARYGLPPVAIDPRMCLAAQKHATWMAQTGVYQHSNLGIPEIIFQGPRSAPAAIQGWIASPAHHSIMLSGHRVGFGYMVIGGRTYWVGLFR